MRLYKGRDDVKSVVAKSRERDGKWYVSELFWKPWWRLDVPVRAHYQVWRANRGRKW